MGLTSCKVCKLPVQAREFIEERLRNEMSLRNIAVEASRLYLVSVSPSSINTHKKHLDQGFRTAKEKDNKEYSVRQPILQRQIGMRRNGF